MDRELRIVLSARVFSDQKCFGPGVSQLLKRVDELHSLRAAALSMMNVGVSLVEIVSLFTSSAIAAFGAGRCFALCGALLAACAIPYFKMTK